MKKKIAAISLVILGLSVVGYFHFRNSEETAESASVSVEALVVKESTLPLEIKAIGTLTARSVEVTPEVPGHVQQILFKDGEAVKQGTPLIQLDDAVYKAKLASAKAQLAFSESDYKRKDYLGKRGAISQQAIDQAIADLKEKRANEEESAVMVNKMALTAPFDGVVSKAKINLGDYVTTGQSLVTITDTNLLRIEYTVPEQYFPLLKVGQLVTLTSATYPDKKFTGKVSYISPTVNTDNRSVALYAEIANDSHTLAPGMFVNVLQALGTQEHAFIIPARSLVPILDGEQVFKIVKGKAYPVTVQLGKRIGDTVQVIDGITKGDLVITDGQLKVKNGTPVTVQR